MAERLYQLRSNGVSQSQFARAADMPDAHYHRIEGGYVMPTLPTCEKIAHAHGISVPELLTGITTFV